MPSNLTLANEAKTNLITVHSSPSFACLEPGFPTRVDQEDPGVRAERHLVMIGSVAANY